MKSYLITGILICCLTSKTRIAAQELSVQVSPGLMNYGGDLQDQPYTFSQSHFTIGANLIYRVNHVSVRTGFSYGQVSADDKKGTKYQFRNLNFQSAITEANLCLQYDLFILDENRKFTPYAFAGIGLYHFNPYTYFNNSKIYLRAVGTEGQGLSAYPDRTPYSLTQFTDPIGAGIKFKISSNIQIGAELGTRLLYTDYLDDVSKRYPDPAQLLSSHGQLAVDLSFRGDEINPNAQFPAGKVRGNPKRNDNYYTSTFSFIYVFSGGSHFSNASGSSPKSIKGLACPKKVH